MTWLLDTNMLVYALKRQGGVRERLNETALRGDRLTMSAVTMAELLYGAERSARRDENRRTILTKLKRIDVIPFGQGAADHYAKIKALLAAAGLPRPRLDLLIAAAALDLGARLVSHDDDLHDVIPDLVVEDWYIEGK